MEIITLYCLLAWIAIMGGVLQEGTSPIKAAIYSTMLVALLFVGTAALFLVLSDVFEALDRIKSS